MQTKKYNNGQRSPPPVPKTGSNFQGTIKAVLGCQKTNGINPKDLPLDHNNNIERTEIGPCIEAPTKVTCNNF